MPLYSEREQTCSKIIIFEDTIRKLESTLAEARSDEVALKDHLIFVDANLAEVQQNAIANFAKVQALESEYVRARLLVGQHASESEFIENILSSEIAAIREEVGTLM